MSKSALRIVGIVFLVVIVVLGGLWFYFRANLHALDAPVTSTGYSYSANEGAVMTAVAQSLTSSPELKDVFTNSSCPATGPNYNINPGAIVSGLLGLIGASGDDGCYKVTGNITITPKIYWMSLSKAVLVVSATGTITIQYYDKDCVLHTETITLSSLEIAFSIKNDGSIGGIVPLPTGKPICVVKLPSKTIPISVGSLDPDKCPNCKNPAPIPIGTETQ